MTGGALRSRRLRIATAAILAVGLSSALAVYLAARPGPGNPLGSDPEDSKQYLRQMEVYGGTANVLASEIREWFGSLWHGKRLAGTIATATILLAGAVWFFGVRTPAGLDRAAEDP
jgi:hypothetical protein